MQSRPTYTWISQSHIKLRMAAAFRYLPSWTSSARSSGKTRGCQAHFLSASSRPFILRFGLVAGPASLYRYYRREWPFLIKVGYASLRIARCKAIVFTPRGPALTGWPSRLSLHLAFYHFHLIQLTQQVNGTYTNIGRPVRARL